MIPDWTVRDTTPPQGWLFAYAAPVAESVVGSLPSTGGIITVFG
jgi:hypothetical protein